MFITVLDDGETYSGAHTSSLFHLDDSVDTESIEQIIKSGDVSPIIRVFESIDNEIVIHITNAGKSRVHIQYEG